MNITNAPEISLAPVFLIMRYFHTHLSYFTKYCSNVLIRISNSCTENNNELKIFVK